MGFSIIGPVGATNLVEESVDLEHWVPLVANTIPLGGAVSFQELVQTSPSVRYYRIRVNSP
jgi:hypothetical protein